MRHRSPAGGPAQTRCTDRLGHPSSGTFYDAAEVESSPAAVTNILCFVYKPEHWSGKRMILVHHGVLRNADEYRDDSIVLGDKFDALVVAPQFDKERFPGIKYQRGGISKRTAPRRCRRTGPTRSCPRSQRPCARTKVRPT